MVTPVHATIAAERQLVATCRNGRAALDLFVAYRILQHIAAKFTVDRKFRQGTVFPLLDTFYLYFHFTNRCLLSGNQGYRFAPIAGALVITCAHTGINTFARS